MPHLTNKTEAVRTLLRTLAELGYDVESGDEMQDRLAYSEADAAKMLGISPRKLFGLRAAGKIRAVKIGSRVTYPRHELMRFLDAEMEGGTADG